MNENKIKNTKIGDDIHFFVNGTEDRGIVVKMNNEYVTVFKESTQNYDDVHIDDTFFIKDILINKEWDKMEDVERFELLQSIHAPTPRFLTKSWDQLPKEIKTLLVKNNGIETSHKKDEDPMDTTVRTKGFGGFERGQGTGKEGEKIGEQTKDDEEIIDTGEHKNPPKFSKDGEKPEGLTHNVSNFDQHKTIEETTGEQKGDARTDIDYLNEGGNNIGAGEHRLSGTDRATEQEVEFGKQQGRKDQGKKDDDVAAGVAALKAWQLWLAEREQQVLKDSLSGDVRIYDDRSDNALPADSPQSHSEASTAAKHPESKQGTHNADIDYEEWKRSNRQDPPSPRYSTEELQNTGAPAGEKIEDKIEAKARSDDEPANMLSDSDYHLQRAAIPKGGKAPKDIKRSINEMMEELKSSVETSIHGNAARNPNSGVNTNTSFDAPKDYEGFSHDGIRLEQFKHENKKPNVGKEKVNINIDGKEKPADSTQGTGDSGNEYNTATQNKTDKKGRIISEKDKKRVRRN
tara:strand:+ start:5673 stop:7223 length:1551 start_codon:yes stop_codon:yes gene_type:complete